MKSDAGFKYLLWNAKRHANSVFLFVHRQQKNLCNSDNLGFYFSPPLPPLPEVVLVLTGSRCPSPSPSVTQKLFALIFSFLPISIDINSTCSPSHSSFHWIEILVKTLPEAKLIQAVASLNNRFGNKLEINLEISWGKVGKGKRDPGCCMYDAWIASLE